MARVPDPSAHPYQKEGTDLNVHQLEEQPRERVVRRNLQHPKSGYSCEHAREASLGTLAVVDAHARGLELGLLRVDLFLHHVEVPIVVLALRHIGPIAQEALPALLPVVCESFTWTDRDLLFEPYAASPGVCATRKWDAKSSLGSSVLFWKFCFNILAIYIFNIFSIKRFFFPTHHFF